MKKTAILGLVSALGAGIMACNSSSNENAGTDTVSTSTSTTTTTVSNTNYVTKADSFRVNSEAGNYLDVRTGKPIKLTIDTTSGVVTDANGKTVKRYVDKRTWWVYDVNTSDTVGSAEMRKGKLMYRGDNDKWMTYDERWSDDSMGNTSTMNDSSGNSGEMKIKTDDHKLKVDEDGTKMK